MPPVRPAAVGGFVLGGLAIIVAAILFFGGGNLLAPKTKAVVFFEGSVGGLSSGAPVTFRGVRVGSVARVAVVVDAINLSARIPVYLQLEPDQVTLAAGSHHDTILRRLVGAGLRAKLVSQSFVTGQMLVELDLNPETPPIFVGDATLDMPEIPAMPSDLEELREQLTQAPIAQTIAQAQRTLIAVEQVANRIDGEINPLAASVQRALDNAGRTMDLAGASVQRLQQDASSTLGEVHDLAFDGRRQLAERGEELSRTLSAAERTIQAIDGLAISANSLVASRSQARNDLEAVLRDLAASAGSVRDFSQSIDHDPSVLLRGRPSR